MRRAALIVNPQAGRASSFDAVLPALSRVLRSHGFSVQVRETTAEPASARSIALQEACSADIVFACGGDGTVHGVLQGLAGTASILGVLPFGTANALARNLGLPVDPALALQKLLTYTPRQIPLGCADTSTEKRWFTVMAGAGPDGCLVREMKLAAKARTARRAYYTEAARLFLSRRFPRFRVEYKLVGSSVWTTRSAVALMASRIPDLGGPFRGLTKASRLHHPHLLIQLLAGPAHLSFPAWLALSRANLEKANPWLSTQEVDEVRCSALHGSRDVHAQVDAEAAGPLPLALRVIPSSLRLLMP